MGIWKTDMSIIRLPRYGLHNFETEYFQIEMVLKIVRYLAQQGYGTGKLVILTLFFIQLHKLRVALKEDNDPILNDLDSYELVKAGLVDPAEANLAKNPRSS